jgi:hypothetical protein
VDRFGQPAPKVKAILLYGHDNPVDGAVLDVLLRKAREIRHTLGIAVPVPMESETVMEAVLKALFFRTPTVEQLSLFDEPIIQNIHHRWDEAAAREQESRTRFAQRAITPEEVERELKETDSVLGNPDAVQRFVLNACQRLDIPVQEGRNGQWTITNLTQLPEMVRTTVPAMNDLWRVTFTTPAPEGSTYLGRNHPFVSALAQYLLEAALTRGEKAPVTRCGVMKTHTVERRVVLFLLRLRFLLTSPEEKETDGEETHPRLAEEVFVCGFRGFPPDRLEWLHGDESLNLLHNARADVNITAQERHEVLSEVLDWWPDLQRVLEPLIEQRARKLEDAHRRVRAAAHLPRRGVSVRPHMPPDLLGTFVLLPVPRGVVR